MNKLKAMLLVFGLLMANNSYALDLSSKSKLACEALLCAVGIAIPDSHDECREILIDWNIYLATLGFFSSPPSCPKTDATGLVVGFAEMNCNLIQDTSLRTECLNARKKPPVNQCEGLPPQQRARCECTQGGRSNVCL
ncbi:hypothetical protein [uncultured Shewanella sp.]|uniref:hypothetical protein n=1 Tax=uncultured Shewanella sp. TaxID=173975 RepID=UPI002601AC76|nr:hypothetical protein [uncultured Shewanella sp.]